MWHTPAGVRRIEAITGDAVTEFYKEEEKKLHEAAALLKASPDSVAEHIRKLQDEIKALRAENESLKSAQAASAMNDWETRVQDVKGVKLLADGLKGIDMNGLRDLGDKIKTRLGEGVIVLVSDNDGKVSVMAMATDEAVRKGAHAGNLIRTLARFVGGGGGGRPQMAQAGGKNAAGIPDLIKAAPEELAKQLH